MFKKLISRKESQNLSEIKSPSAPASKYRFGMFTKKLGQAKVARKLFVCTATTIVALLLVGGLGIVSLSIMNKEIEKMYSENLLGAELAAEAERTVRIMSEAGLKFAVETDENAKPPLRQAIFNGNKDFEKVIAKLAKTLATAEEKELLQHLQEDYAEYSETMEDLITSFSPAKALQTYSEKVVPAQEHVAEAVNQLVVFNTQAAENAYQGSETLFYSVSALFLAILVGAILLSTLLNVFISRTITKALNRVNERASQVANGDLAGEELVVSSRDEIGQLTQSFNIMTANLRQLIQQITKDADNLAASAQEMSATLDEESQAVKGVASAAYQLATGAEEQSKKIEEAMSFIEQSSAAIEEISATAQEVAASTQEVSQKASTGNEAMGQAKAEMEHISLSTEEIAAIIYTLGDQSKTIGNIVNLISGIAEQTNLLALNAAIEAARAGDQGRGFAVVAEEVRKLADQSQQAAKEISVLIKAIQEDSGKAVEAMEKNKTVVENGSQVIAQGADTFTHIAFAVEEVLRQIQEVSRSTEELAKGSEDMVKSMEVIDRITREVYEASHQMATTTEEQTVAIGQIGIAAQSLTDLGQELQEQTGKFKL